MNRVGILILCALLWGCHQKQPKMSDAQMRKLRVAEPELTDRCLEKIRWGGIEALTGPGEDCFKFDPPKRWKGLWFGAFEESRFCPDPARRCSFDTPGESIWLQPGPRVQLPHYASEPSPPLCEVDFVGRKTSYPSGYGHSGQSNEEIIMDRLISMKPVQPRTR